MTRPADRPLSEAQEKALLTLAGVHDRAVAGERETPWIHKPCRDARTLDALAQLGLIETRPHGYTLEQEARINDKGLALLASMGD